MRFSGFCRDFLSIGSAFAGIACFELIVKYTDLIFV